MSFEQQLRDIFQVQKERIDATYADVDLDAAFEALESKRLDPASIDQDCCAQLKIILNKRYDTPQPYSHRLDKFGWSAATIRAHMVSFLRRKLQLANDIIEAYVKDPDGAAAMLRGMDPEASPNQSADTFTGDAWHKEQAVRDLENDAADAGDTGDAAVMASTLDELLDE